MKKRTVLVTGGAGYVGAVLVPNLLENGYRVRVLDLYIFGEDVLGAVKNHPDLKQVKGDIRDRRLLAKVLNGCDSVIHLACISNDPSVELAPELSKEVNYDAFISLLRLSKEAGVFRFILASSGSVYGVSEAKNVTEEHPLVPISLYNRYKAMCEGFFLEAISTNFSGVVVRPGTICGYSPRQRLDLTVNILTNHAVNAGKIKVFGGAQMRPNLHILDMSDLYLMLMELPESRISGKVYNVVCQNYTVAKTAEIIRKVVVEEMPEKKGVEIVTESSSDPRSYHISGEKIRRELGFVPERTIEDGVRDLVRAFREGKIPNPLTDIRYYNIKTMKHLNLK